MKGLSLRHIFKEEVKEKGLQKKIYDSYFQFCKSARRAERSETAEGAHWKSEGIFERMRQIKGLGWGCTSSCGTSKIRRKTFHRWASSRLPVGIRTDHGMIKIQQNGLRINKSLQGAKHTKLSWEQLKDVHSQQRGLVTDDGSLQTGPHLFLGTQCLSAIHLDLAIFAGRRRRALWRDTKRQRNPTQAADTVPLKTCYWKCSRLWHQIEARTQDWHLKFVIRCSLRLTSTGTKRYRYDNLNWHNERGNVEAFVEKKRKIADQERRKARAQKVHNVSSNFTYQRREKQETKTKNLRSQDNSAWRQYRKKTVKSVSGKEDRPPCYSYMEGTL